MSAEPQYTDSETENDAPAALHLSAVKERRNLRVVGDTEVHEEEHELAEGGEPRRRKPLAVQPVARRRRRLSLVVATVLGVCVTLGVVLLLNISMSSNQYDLVQLRDEQRSLSEQNQKTSQEIEYHQAPQNLAIRASQLGMVSASDQAQLDLKNSSVSGTPTPAEKAPADKEEAKKNGQTNLIDPPLNSETDAAKQAEKQKQEAQEKDSDSSKPSQSSSSSSDSEHESHNGQNQGNN
ncbi:hypothetical protein [Rothia uropygialis]|uniref:hypothetical protein n=1 Tax=Kocuria sp. 36 TaxID=1415402 RepID=UPI00101BD5B1|nr:hypothetical protein [Kocuria sp. 36]